MAASGQERRKQRTGIGEEFERRCMHGSGLLFVVGVRREIALVAVG